MVVVSTARDYSYSGQGIGTILRNHILPGLDVDDTELYTLGNSLNGSWYWPENSGQGLNLEVLDDKVVAY